MLTCTLAKRLALLSRLHRFSKHPARVSWAPPSLLSTEPRDADDLLAGPENISPDDNTAEFVTLEKLKRIEEVEALKGNTFDFDKLYRVEQGYSK
ncbi:hypothetical protein BDR03DRAFT_975358 [Suillus americanus]|nr:hypothetical protein BDR03DRAFT_975358 [Suillus americanus]